MHPHFRRRRLAFNITDEDNGECLIRGFALPGQEHWQGKGEEALPVSDPVRTYTLRADDLEVVGILDAII